MASPKPAAVSSVYQWQLQVSLLNYSQSSSSWQWWLDSPDYTLTWTDVERCWQLSYQRHSRLMTAEQWVSTARTVIWVKVIANALQSTCIGKILKKCISERSKLQFFTKFHGKLPISRKTVHFAVRVTAVKSRNRLGLTYDNSPTTWKEVVSLEFVDT